MWIFFHCDIYSEVDLITANFITLTCTESIEKNPILSHYESLQNIGLLNCYLFTSAVVLPDR